MDLIYANGIDYDSSTFGFQYDINPVGGFISVTTDPVVGPVVNQTVGFTNGAVINGSSFIASTNVLTLTGLYKPSSVGSNQLFGFFSANNQEFNVTTNIDHSLSIGFGDLIHNGGITAVTQPLTNLTNTYNVISMTITFATGVGGSVQIYYNGVALPLITGIPTKITNNPITNIGHGQVSYRDETIYDSSGTFVVPAGKHLRLITDYPIGDDVVGWTPSAGGTNFNLVNSPVPNGGTTFVSTDVNGTQDTYTWPALPGNVVSVLGVKTGIIAQHDVGANKIVAIPYKNVITTLGSNIALPTNTYGYYSDYQTVDPNSTVQWTPAGVNATKIGINLVS